MVECQELHIWASKLPRFNFDYRAAEIPLNGLYLLFEKGELAHGVDRIVRVGTHTGQDQLRSRLKQHFLTENKDRSIFRKNIGRALLNRVGDKFLEKWELDLTPSAARKLHGGTIDFAYQKGIEQEVTQYMHNHFSFAVIGINEKEERLALESKIISTISHCRDCGPSNNWLGKHSPKEKIRQNGLWLVNELYKEPLSEQDFQRLQALASQ